jgi:hypothetical protein
MRANEFILERVTGTIDPRTGDVDMVNQRTGKMTQLRKDTRTDMDDTGTKVYRGGKLRSISTPKIGGFQATQTFRPDSTPGYQQVDYETGGISVSAKGSPETGYDQSVRYKSGDMDVGTTQKYSGQKSMDIGYELAPGKKIRATSTISKPGAKPVNKMSINEKPLDDITLQRVLKFANDRDMYNSGTNDAVMSTKGTNELIAKARAQEKSQRVTNVPARAHSKDGVHKQGFKSVTFPKSNSMSNVKMSTFDDVQAAIREHVAKRVPFTECMFRPGSAAFTEFYRQVRECADKLNLDWEDQELLATDIGECIMVEGEMVALDVPMIDEGGTPYDDEEEMTPEEEAFVDMVVDYYRGEGYVGNPTTDHMDSYDHERMADAYDIAGGDPSDTVGRGNFLHREITQRLGLGEDINEAEYQGRKVKLNSPKRGGSKKFYVYTKNKKGNVIKVSWGDTTGLSVKAKDRGAVKSFVARHKCKEKNDKTKAGYWACRTPRYKSLGVKGGQWW